MTQTSLMMNRSKGMNVTIHLRPGSPQAIPSLGQDVHRLLQILSTPIKNGNTMRCEDQG